MRRSIRVPPCGRRGGRGAGPVGAVVVGLGDGEQKDELGSVCSSWWSSRFRHVVDGAGHRGLLHPGVEAIEVGGGHVGGGDAGALDLDRVVPEEPADPSLVDDQLVVVDADEVGVGVVPADRVRRPRPAPPPSRITNRRVRKVIRRRPRASRRSRRLALRRSPAAGRLLLGHRRPGRGRRHRPPASDRPATGVRSRRSPRPPPEPRVASSSPTTTSTTTTVMLSLPPWVRAACTSRSAARLGSRTEERTSVIWSGVELVGQAVAAQQEPVAPDRAGSARGRRPRRTTPRGPGSGCAGEGGRRPRPRSARRSGPSPRPGCGRW